MRDFRAERVARRFLAAITGESYFFDNPQYRETREFVETEALSNVPGVGVNAVRESANETVSVRTERKRVDETPPTPNESLRDTPGAKDFSTLSRLLVETTQPTDRDVPKGRDELPSPENLGKKPR